MLVRGKKLKQNNCLKIEEWLQYASPTLWNITQTLKKIMETRNMKKISDMTFIEKR